MRPTLATFYISLVLITLLYLSELGGEDELISPGLLLEPVAHDPFGEPGLVAVSRVDEVPSGLDERIEQFVTEGFGAVGGTVRRLSEGHGAETEVGHAKARLAQEVVFHRCRIAGGGSELYQLTKRRLTESCYEHYGATEYVKNPENG